MRFHLTRPIAGGASADADPRTNPGDVPDEAVFDVPTHVRGTDGRPTRLLLTLEGTATQSADVRLYVLEEGGDPAVGDVPSQVERAARLFYGVTPSSAITVTVGEMVEMTAVVPGPGKVYARVTSVPAADSVLKIAAA